MLKNITYGFVFLAAICFSNEIAFADDIPTLDQVYQAAHAGRIDDAQRMMGTVLKVHPESAKAHYVEAELLAKQGQMGQAETELNTAQRLKPDCRLPIRRLCRT
ncbi:MAG: tetratricopeptide repeat protein [Nitrosomonadales bacterium]